MGDAFDDNEPSDKVSIDQMFAHLLESTLLSGIMTAIELKE